MGTSNAKKLARCKVRKDEAGRRQVDHIMTSFNPTAKIL
jgi:hypothetical protein